MDINYQIEKKLKQARIKMFRKDVGLMLFGATAYKFDWVVEPMPENICEGYVAFDIENSSNPFDGDIHINENYISKEDYTHDNLIALIIHETLHIFKKHGSRRGNRDTTLWNLACDHVVDRDLKELNLSPYEDRFNVILELDRINPNCSTEEAYKWLVDQKARFNVTQKGENTSQIDDNNTGRSYTVNNTPDDTTNSSDTDKEKLKNKTDQFVSEARALNQTLKEKSKGDSPGKIQEYLDKLLEVKIDWHKLLEKAIKTNAILKPQERSWKRLNQYYTPHNITLPGMGMEEEKENVGTLVCAIDSSGSISSIDLKKFAYVLNQSLQYFNEVILLVHDTKIQQVIKFQQDEYSTFYDFVKNIGFKGRGGTSHKEVFDYVENKIWADNDKRDVLSIVMSLTDGYSDIERNYKKYKWIKNNTPLVFIVNNYNFKLKNELYPMIDTIYIN